MLTERLLIDYLASHHNDDNHLFHLQSELDQFIFKSIEHPSHHDDDYIHTYDNNHNELNFYNCHNDHYHHAILCHYHGTTSASRCNNDGLQYAVQTNRYIRGRSPTDPQYSAFEAQPFETVVPSVNGSTPNIGLARVPNGGTGSIYGGPARTLVQTVLHHRGYLFAQQAGTFQFFFNIADDIAILWVGTTALNGQFSRGNAATTQHYNASQPVNAQTSVSYSYTARLGEYVPMRIIYANAGGDAEFRLTVIAPDGSTASNGSSTAYSPYLVQRSCDGVVAPPFPDWPQPVTTTTTTTAAGSTSTSSIR
ncbi:unnamed protein product [Zymoseptoria tritici ST99CH_1A5]|uniref:PA14 domain-containing protein n=1 Tax=Zymoseptoria tritici ST99CH_1A5 TaxID=1276529 RepID=A0A1Y6LDI6_ZYMTR|nr:unnamed protein product [Zymoseptoria tritici ST99CH_1A5]